MDAMLHYLLYSATEPVWKIDRDTDAWVEMVSLKGHPLVLHLLLNSSTIPFSLLIAMLACSAHRGLTSWSVLMDCWYTWRYLVSFQIVHTCSVPHQSLQPPKADVTQLLVPQ